MRIVFSTHVSDDWFEPVGTKKLLNSAKHFHPNIDFVVFNSKDIERKFKDPLVNWDTLIAPLCVELADDYDMVVHFDADSCITGELTDLLTADFEIAGVRNNNDFGKAGNAPIGFQPKGTDPFTYINAGLVASTKKEFWHEWIKTNNENAQYCSMAEQDTLNHVFHSGKYKSKILDPLDSNLHYGTSTQFGNGTVISTHWDSWKSIKLKNNQLYLNNKIVKVLHHAGGHQLPKLGLDLFNPKVSSYIKFIADPPILKDASGKSIILKNYSFIKMLDNSDFLANTMKELNFKIGDNLNVVDYGAKMGLHGLYLASKAKQVYIIKNDGFEIIEDIIKQNNIVNVKVVSSLPDNFYPDVVVGK